MLPPYSPTQHKTNIKPLYSPTLHATNIQPSQTYYQHTSFIQSTSIQTNIRVKETLQYHDIKYSVPVFNSNLSYQSPAFGVCCITNVSLL